MCRNKGRGAGKRSEREGGGEEEGGGKGGRERDLEKGRIKGMGTGIESIRMKTIKQLEYLEILMRNWTLKKKRFEKICLICIFYVIVIAFSRNNRFTIIDTDNASIVYDVSYCYRFPLS